MGMDGGPTIGDGPTTEVPIQIQRSKMKQKIVPLTMNFVRSCCSDFGSFYDTHWVRSQKAA